jgi:L-asparaginase
LDNYQSAAAKRPVLVVHGGASAEPKNPETHRAAVGMLKDIAGRSFALLQQGGSALAAAAFAVETMERCELFNAGRGGKLQRDGIARLSASMMDGTRRKFSAVNLVTEVDTPSRLALALQERDESVLGPYGAQLLARELGMPPASPATARRALEWLEYLEQAECAEPPHGTVGAVALDLDGHLAAATSTGGFVTSSPDRMSDSATVAGNYASQYAAISCTGKGEQIVDDGVAVRLETRVRDGLNIIQASEKSFAEAQDAARQYAWIGLDAHGNVAVYGTAASIAHALRHG